MCGAHGPSSCDWLDSACFDHLPVPFGALFVELLPCLRERSRRHLCILAELSLRRASDTSQQIGFVRCRRKPGSTAQPATHVSFVVLGRLFGRSVEETRSDGFVFALTNSIELLVTIR